MYNNVSTPPPFSPHDMRQAEMTSKPVSVDIIDPSNAPRPLMTFRSQSNAMMRKNAILTLRQPCSLCCQIILPLLILAGLLTPTIIIRATVGDREDLYSSSLSLRTSTFPASSIASNPIYAGDSSFSRYGSAFGEYLDERPSDQKSSYELGVLKQNDSTSTTGFFANHWQMNLSNPYSGYASKYIPNYKPIKYESREKWVQALYDLKVKAISESDWSKKRELLTDVPDWQIFVKNLARNSSSSVEFMLPGTRGEVYFSGEWSSPATTAVSLSSFWTSALATAYNPLNQIKIAASTGYMMVVKTVSVNYVSAIMTIWMLPISGAFLLPLVVQNIVNEKEHRIVEMMKIMGMSLNVYWFSQWVFFFIIGLIVSTVIIIACLIAKIPAIYLQNPLVYILLFFFHSAAQSSTGIFLSNFFQRQKVAVMVMYLITIVSLVSGAALNQFLFAQNKAPFWFMMYAPWAFTRGVYVMLEFLLWPGYNPLSFAEVFSSEITIVFAYLIAEAIIYLFVTSYIEKVWPKDHGIAESPLYPIHRLMRLFKRRNTGETERLLGGYDANPRDEAVVVVKDIRKNYSGKNALDGLSLNIQAGECLGLLGPNGAGKSTLAHILSGMTTPSSGNAWVGGYNIKNEMPLVRTVLGLCPQHEIVWDELTVEEHLLFYIRLKNIPSQMEYYESDRILASVGLLYDKTKRVNQLSGGMKRRLSIAISLVGNPVCLILDEPTTGLDPDTRRSVWDMIQSQKPGRAIILTTHNMEEADTLSSRIGIVSRGSLVCIGEQLELKKRFGKGYKLSINPTLQSSQVAQDYILRSYPSATLDVISAGTISFYIPTADVDIAKLFSEMNAHKEEYGIMEWGISQASLEEVFIKVVEADEADELTN